VPVSDRRASATVGGAPDGRRVISGNVAECYAAMTQIAENGRGPKDQIVSMVCSIKWG
jgi:hypothetical protein